MSEAADRARAGEGPTFIEAKTYRFRGHSMSDPAKYRTKEELEKAKERDPIVLYEVSSQGTRLGRGRGHSNACTTRSRKRSKRPSSSPATPPSRPSTTSTRYQRRPLHSPGVRDPSMPVIQYREALNQAMCEEMERDDRVFLMGEEVAEYNGAYKVSQGMLDRFGPRRVVDTPISEEGFAGIGIGAAMVGLRPIVEFMTFSFSLVAFDQIVNNAANMRYMSGGQFTVPIVFRGSSGMAGCLGATHSHRPEAIYAHVPGLNVVMPSTPDDAKGLLKTAIRCDDPVIFIEHENLYGEQGEVPEDELPGPLRQGRHQAPRHGRHPHHLLPPGAHHPGRRRETRRGRHRRRGHRPPLHPAPRPRHPARLRRQDPSRRHHRGKLALLRHRRRRGRPHLSHQVFDELDAPIRRVTTKDAPIPYNKRMEQSMLPSVDRSRRRRQERALPLDAG